MAVPGSPSLIVISMISVDVKQHLKKNTAELSCVKVEVDVQGSLPRLVPTVSVDVKQHLKNATELRGCV